MRWEVVNPRLREACELIDEVLGPELALRASALAHTTREVQED